MQAMKVNVTYASEDVVFPSRDDLAKSSFALGASIRIPVTLLKERASSKFIQF